MNPMILIMFPSFFFQMSTKMFHESNDFPFRFFFVSTKMLYESDDFPFVFLLCQQKRSMNLMIPLLQCCSVLQCVAVCCSMLQCVASNHPPPFNSMYLAFVHIHSFVRVCTHKNVCVRAHMRVCTYANAYVYVRICI